MDSKIAEAVSYHTENGVYWKLIGLDNVIIEHSFESSADAIDWALSNGYLSPQHEYDNYIDDCRETNKHPIIYTEWVKSFYLGNLSEL